MRVAGAARKHQVGVDDMRHAVRNATVAWTADDAFTMLVGPDRTGDLLEIGVIGIDTDDPVIVHAMRCRPRFLPPQ